MSDWQPEPGVVIALREFKQGLLARESAQMQTMAARWLQVEQGLGAQIDSLVYYLADLRAQGQIPTRSQIYQLQRYRTLLAQAERQFNEYAKWASDYVTRGQAEMVRYGIDHAYQATQTSYEGQIPAYFDRLSVEATENMIGLAGNGQPIGDLIYERMVRDANGAPLPGVFERVTQTLVEATAQGWNPRETARVIRDDITGGLQSALTIARTEQLRVYREAGVEQYRQSGVVIGMRRLVAHDGRACAACLADEGTVYPINAIIPDHPNGRCGQVPIVEGMDPVSWLGGEEWLRLQDEDVQMNTLGPGRFELWQSGRIRLSDLVVHTQSEEWGAGIAVRPLGDL